MPELTKERLAEIKTTLRIHERPVRDVAPAVHDAANYLLAEVRRLRAENERLRAERPCCDIVGCNGNCEEWAYVGAARDGGEG